MYNNYGVFKWNQNHKGFVNGDNRYSDILFYTGGNIKGQWGNQIAIDDNKRIVMKSNHFIHHRDYGRPYDNNYKIYTNLVDNYKRLCEAKNVCEDYNDDKEYFFLTNSFLFTNSGHDLSVMLDRIKWIEKLGSKHVILMNGYKERNNYKLIKLLLPDDITIHELEFGKVYKFKNAVITHPEFYNICKYPELHEEIKSKIIERYEGVYEELKGKKVLLIKSHRNGEVMKPRTSVTCEEFIALLEDNGFIYINPEIVDMYKIAIYLIFADTIVFNDGAISYTHFNLFGKDSTCMHLSIRGNKLQNGDGDLRKRMITIPYRPVHLKNEYERVAKDIIDSSRK